MGGSGAASFGVRLREWRRLAGLTQEDLAARTGLSVRTVRGLERDRVQRPRRDTVRLLSAALESAGAEDLALDLPAGPEPGGGAAAGPPEQTGPCQLPPETAGFVGRDEVVDALAGVLSDGRPWHAAVLSGPPGVGKTACAVRVAHRLRPAFPDGQLYLTLTGPGGEEVEPAALLAEALRGLGVEERQLPDQADARAALLRSVLAARRVLLVLDAAAGERQVRPFLPGTGGSAVLVTSRRRLGGLDGTAAYDLGTLDGAESRQLLAGEFLGERLAAEPEATRRLVDLCGGLPLALRVVAARLTARPHWSVAELADTLEGSRRRLDVLEVSDLSVRTSLDAAYRTLPAADATAFGLLALPGGPDFAAWELAALAAWPLPQAADSLESLADARLVDVHLSSGPGGRTYRLHDLVHLFAGERLRETVPAAGQDAARDRLFAAWLALAEHAAAGLPVGVLGGRRASDPGEVFDPGQREALVGDSLSWFEGRRVALRATVEQAAVAGDAAVACDLAGAAAAFYEVHGHYEDWERTHRAALGCARRRDCRVGVARMLLGLAEAHVNRQQLDQAEPLLTEALALFRTLRDASGEGHVLHDLGVVAIYRQNRAEAADLLGAAAAVFTGLGEELRAAQSRMALATVRRDQGRVDEAEEMLTAALTTFRAAGKPHSEAFALLYRARLDISVGRLARAEIDLGRACELAVDLGDAQCESRVLRALGEVRLAAGRRDEARALIEHGLAVADRAGHAHDRAQAQAELEQLAAQEGRPREAAPPSAGEGRDR